MIDSVGISSSEQRLKSLDALRGFDMFWIIGGDSLIHALAALTKWGIFTWTATQMTHSGWNGFRFYDLIFPLFIFIAGVAMPYSIDKRVERGDDKLKLLLHILKRGAILVLLGIVYNNGLFVSDIAEWRFPSVLGRIGLAYMFAGVIVLFTTTRQRIWSLIAILLGYWAMLELIPVPGGTEGGEYGLETSLVGYLDHLILPGKLFLGVHDPEGLVSTIPAIATALLGVLVGEGLRKHSASGGYKAAAMALGGILCVLLGWIWHLLIPVNKNLWTSSFVLVAGGFSLILLSLFYYLIDVRGWQRWSFFFVVIGMNPILIYFSTSIINWEYATDFFVAGVFQHIDNPEAVVVLWLASLITLKWVFLWFLHRHRLYLKV